LADDIFYSKKKKKKTYLKKETHSSGPGEQRRGQQQLEPGRLLVAGGFSRLGRGRSLLRCNLNVVELARLLLLVRESAALVSHMTNFAAAETPLLGDEVGLVLRGELRGARSVVGVVVAREVVDLGSKVVDGDMEVIDIHRGGFNLGGNGGHDRVLGEENGVDQACLIDGLIQTVRLAKLNLLAGVGLEPLDIPMKRRFFVKGGDAALEATELMSVECNRSFSLLERLHGFSCSRDSIGRGMEGKERLLENRPRSGSDQTRCSPPGLGIVLEVKGRVLHPVV
jgi:hypothetical protein